PGKLSVRTLGDGLRGKEFFNGQDWCAWDGQTTNITIEFPEATEINSITLGLFSSPASWIYPPESVQVKGSEDLVNYQIIGNFDLSGLSTGQIEKALKLNGVKVRGLRLSVRPLQKIQADRPGEGHHAWTFIDEIIIH
ncbi:MAG: hypothetical protein M3R25_05520, partial [Bacteroidota bacterium]|nr:hypothetical protein [Bacteroidota bacterium]